MLVINVKYHGPTNHRGSRWTATMAVSFSGEKLRASAPFQYGDSDGSEDAVVALLKRWDERVIGLGCAAKDWTFARIGTDHRGEEVFTAYKV